MDTRIISIVEGTHSLLHDYMRTNEVDWCHDLCGACAVGARIVYEILIKKNLKPTFVYGTNTLSDSGHCWVELDNWILDPTSEQFYNQKPWTVTLKPEASYITPFSAKVLLNKQATRYINQHWDPSDSIRGNKNLITIAKRNIK